MTDIIASFTRGALAQGRSRQIIIWITMQIRDCFLKAMSSQQEQEGENMEGAVKMWPEDFNPVCP